MALKFVPVDFGSDDKERHSLEILRRVRHPNLMTPFGAWTLNGWLVIGMEMADGSLDDRLESVRDEGMEGIPPDELLEYMAEAAKGIDYLNSNVFDFGNGKLAGVQHRDLKPQNILLVGGGVKVADFGIARILSGSVTGHTGSMTFAYAAPEFFKGYTAAQSDQYSLAITYYQLRTGKFPFEGDSMEQMMTGHLLEAPDLSGLPEEEHEIVAKSLSKEPKDRWGNCREFVDALQIRREALKRFRVGKMRCEVDDCIANFTETIRLYPSYASAYLERGKAHLRSGDKVKAIADLDEAIRLDPNAADARIEKGRFLRADGDISGALAQFEDCVRRFPRHGLSYFERGMTLQEKGSLEEAIRDYRTTLKCFPDDESTCLYLAEALEKKGHWDIAAECYTVAMTQSELLGGLFQFRRGGVYYELSKYDEAIADINRSIISNNWPFQAAFLHFAFFLLGHCHYRKGVFSRAVADYSEAIRRNPNEWSYYNSRCRANGALGHLSQAREDHDKAVMLSPPNISPKPHV